MLHCAQHTSAAQMQHHKRGPREGVLARDRAASKTAFGCASGASNPPGHEALCFRPCVAIYEAMCTNKLVVHFSHAGRRGYRGGSSIGACSERATSIRVRCSGAHAAHRTRGMKPCASTKQQQASCAPTAQQACCALLPCREARLPRYRPTSHLYPCAVFGCPRAHRTRV